LEVGRRVGKRRRERRWVDEEEEERVGRGEKLHELWLSESIQTSGWDGESEYVTLRRRGERVVR